MESQPLLAAEPNREALVLLTAAPCLGEIPYIETWRLNELPWQVFLRSNLSPGRWKRVYRVSEVSYCLGSRGALNRSGAAFAGCSMGLNRTEIDRVYIKK
jgi:hypothetical protein